MPDRSFFDQLGNKLTLPRPPQRIVSLVPSQTELLHHLGLHQQVVGITKFCVHPHEWLKTKQIIGGTKQFHFDAIEALQPDLIIGNKEENYKDGIEKLQQQYPVWMSDITSLNDAITMIRSIGELTSSETRAAAIISSITSAFATLKKHDSKRVLYLIWRKPWMAAGSQTFINTMLEMLGLVNCLAGKPRYPEITSDEIATLRPDVILLSSEPYPFQEKHYNEIQQLAPTARIMLVDGEMFSWYGSRLMYAPEYLNKLEF
ncbi:ABC transporter substrate-binding protein [Fulvivirgaceae bacterium PWU4]|uniref:ABC transporter substrate-binding protein n=1 Tax=Chryseosolibacter histidini TaxID=2782349 RepID=A0AAP2DHN8_9BACT|nr:helical backbone metal receptor [Chryseosolibacter histidini]MBT1696588.1 ABC transporter substrate-binding protein [Chryseosolibacter histidini]